MRLFILFLIMCLFSAFSSTATAINKNISISKKSGEGTIKGRVLDKETGDPLVGVNVVVEGTRRGTVTNQNGVFTISKLPAGKYTLIFELIGYARKKHDNITVTSNQTVDMQVIEMEEQPIPLKEIVVTPGSYSIMGYGSEPSVRQTLTSEDIEMMGWAEDITRAVQRIPGISSDEFSAKFAIRGGDVDEVLVLLDGMQIYRPFHQKDFGGGLFSTVDIETIEGVDLLTGGFTADYGDRMSGVLNMRTKTPEEGQRQTSVGFSLMNARFFSMGTFNDNKGAWLFSGRRGYLDILNRLMNNEFKLEPRYYDLLGKVEYKLNKKHSLSLHGFLANDAYKLDEKENEPGKTRPNIDFVETEYGNNYGWLTLESFFSPQLHGRTILYGGSVKQKRFWNNFDDDPNFHFRSATLDDDRDFDLFGFKQDWDYEVSQNVLLKLGVDIKRLNVKYKYNNNIKNEFITANETLIDQIIEYEADKTQDGSQVGLYLSSRFKIFSPLALETGIRYDDASYTNDQFWSPRVSMVYSVAKKSFVRAGWGHYYQTQGIDDLNIQFEETSYHPAQLAEHFVLGIEHLFNNGLHFRAEGYYKRMSDMRDAYLTFRDIDEFFPEARDDLIKLIFDEANAKGLEFYLKYDTGNKFSWWLSYVLSDAKNDVKDIQYEGRLVKQTGLQPRPWDQRHTINIDANYRLNKKWHFNLSWQYRTGWPETPFDVKRIQRENGSYAYYQDYGTYYGNRYPDYQRLDARMNRHFYSSRGKISAFLHIINVYNHENVIRYDHEIIGKNSEEFRFVLEKETWFGIIPFAGVSWEF